SVREEGRNAANRVVTTSTASCSTNSDPHRTDVPSSTAVATSLTRLRPCRAAVAYRMRTGPATAARKCQSVPTTMPRSSVGFPGPMRTSRQRRTGRGGSGGVPRASRCAAAGCYRQDLTRYDSLPADTGPLPYRRSNFGEVCPQLADRLVLLVADALGRRLQLRGDVLHRPALEAQVQDAPLPCAEQRL